MIICQFRGYCCVRASDPPTWICWPCWNNTGDGKSSNLLEKKFRNTRIVVLGRKRDAKGAKDKVKGRIMGFFFLSGDSLVGFNLCAQRSAACYLVGDPLRKE